MCCEFITNASKVKGFVRQKCRPRYNGIMTMRVEEGTPRTAWSHTALARFLDAPHNMIIHPVNLGFSLARLLEDAENFHFVDAGLCHQEKTRFL